MAAAATNRLREKIIAIYDLLNEAYGPKLPRGYDPLETLIRTILSQNTNDANRDRAYDALRLAFPTWEAVRDAPTDEVAQAIRIAGLANQKAPAIQTALRSITARAGRLSLDFLRSMTMESARKWLLSLKGVGPKTAAVVLCFAFGEPAFPVDTHVFRVAKRLGLIGPKTTREEAHLVLEALIPPEYCYGFHLNLIEHGRQVCRASKPLCPICNLQRYCDYYNAAMKPGQA